MRFMKIYMIENFNVYIEHRDIKEDVHKGDKKL